MTDTTANGRRLPNRLDNPFKSAVLSWESLLVLVALGIFIANSFASPYFLNAWSLSDLTFNFTEKGLIALAMASNGLPALLLPNATTAHRRFALPVTGMVTPDVSYGIDKHSDKAEILRQAKVMCGTRLPPCTGTCSRRWTAACGTSATSRTSPWEARWWCWEATSGSACRW